jgi:hypothetical protein
MIEGVAVVVTWQDSTNACTQHEAIASWQVCLMPSLTASAFSGPYTGAGMVDPQSNTNTK